jgi:hypothetical protein
MIYEHCGDFLFWLGEKQRDFFLVRASDIGLRCDEDSNGSSEVVHAFVVVSVPLSLLADRNVSTCRDLEAFSFRGGK